MLVALDDAQWIDRTSLESLVFAAHRCDADRVGFLFAHRTGLPCLLDRTAFDRIELGGLPCDGAVDLLAEVGIDAAVAARCWQLTRGNPLALVEAGRNLSPRTRPATSPSRPSCPSASGCWTRSATSSPRLPAATRLALGVAALGADDDIATVAAALDRPGRPARRRPGRRVGRRDRGGRPAGVVAPPARPAAVLHHRRSRPARASIVRWPARPPTPAATSGRCCTCPPGVLGPDEAVAQRMAELGAVARRRGALPAAATPTGRRAG